MKEKFVKKYMRLAKFISEDQIPCLSRGIGSIIVDPVKNRIISTGYNGPVKGAPHHDQYKYLHEVVLPYLTEDDKKYIKINYNIDSDLFAEAFNNCRTCPRKLIGAKSGERMELCQCEHSERNAIYNAIENLTGYYIFCWCGVPCNDCARAIIQNGISRVYCINQPEQHIEGNNGYGLDRSVWLFKNCEPSVDLILLDEKWILSNEN